MVRLIQLEGFSSSDNIYHADSAYVDVLLKHIGSKSKKQADNPPKLDIALQQVYYFIISQDQLFSYKLVFKVNTFDESFRRTVSGEVEVDLFEELKKHIFTGAEVILSKDIQPASNRVICVFLLHRHMLYLISNLICSSFCCCYHERHCFHPPSCYFRRLLSFV